MNNIGVLSMWYIDKEPCRRLSENYWALSYKDEIVNIIGIGQILVNNMQTPPLLPPLSPLLKSRQIRFMNIFIFLDLNKSIRIV